MYSSLERKNIENLPKYDVMFIYRELEYLLINKLIIFCNDFWKSFFQLKIWKNKKRKFHYYFDS